MCVCLSVCVCLSNRLFADIHRLHVQLLKHKRVHWGKTVNDKKAAMKRSATQVGHRPLCCAVCGVFRPSIHPSIRCRPLRSGFSVSCVWRPRCRLQ